MRIFVTAVLVLGLVCLTSEAFAESAEMKSVLGSVDTAKMKNLNRISLGLYQSLSMTRAKAPSSMNASLKSAAVGVNAEEKFHIEHAALTNGRMTTKVGRNASRLHSNAIDNSVEAEFTSNPTPSNAKMNKLH